MKFVHYKEEWPDSYKLSYHYDLMEIYGQVPKAMIGYYNQYQNRKNSVLKFIKKYLHTGASILDVAAAQGNFSLELAELGYEVTWNDLREELVDYVKMKYEVGNLNFIPGNVFNINPSKKYDLILITEIIEHVAHPDDFLLQIAKLVKPNGYIVMSTPNGAYFLNNLPKFTEHDNPSIFESQQFKPNADGHIFLIHPEELSWFSSRTHLEILNVEYYSNLLTNGHLKTSLLLKVIPSSIISLLENFGNKLPGFLSKKLHSGMTVVFQKNVESL